MKVWKEGVVVLQVPFKPDTRLVRASLARSDREEARSKNRILKVKRKKRKRTVS